MMGSERTPHSEPSASHDRPRAEGRETGRLEAFSDGVFAIAITLLILSIPVPISGGDLWAEVLAQGWAFAAYAISFATILIMWINHHSVFKQVARIDRPFLIVNGLLLMLVTFLNYPTELVARYMSHLESPQAHTAVLIYTGTFILIAVLFTALWFYAAHNGRLLARDADPRVVRAISRAYRFGSLYYAGAFVIAYFSPLAGLIADAALAIYFAVFGRDTL
jgi:uncharacterized membrane protein